MIPKSPFIQWIMLNVIIFAVGIGLGAGHYPVDFDGLRCTEYEAGTTLADCFQFGALLGANTGFAVGIGQNLFLRRRLRWSLKQQFAWVMLTVLAFSLGHAIGDSAPLPQVLPLSAIAQGVLSGALLGGLQWLVLRQQITRASRWVWQSILGFGVGLGIVGVATLVLLDADRNSVLGWNGGFDLLLFVVLDGLFVGGLWAITTGRVLFSRQPAPPTNQPTHEPLTP